MRKIITALAIAAAVVVATPAVAAAQPLPYECNYAKSLNPLSVLGPWYASDGHARVDTYSPSCQSALTRYGLWAFTGFQQYWIDTYGGHWVKRYRHI